MSWYSKLRNAVFPQHLDQELAEEMQDHWNRRVSDLIAQGHSPFEAERLAAVCFGNATSLREQSREVRLWSFLESTLQDIQYALRGMRKNPAFAATAILSLSLAIGANTAIYSIVDAAMLKTLPVPNPGQLFTLATPDIEQPGTESADERDYFNYPLFLQFRSSVAESARIALFSSANRVDVQIPSANAPFEKLDLQYVSGESFDILGIAPAIGRLLSREDDSAPGAHPVAVLSHDYWRDRFGSDQSILGQRMQIEGKAYTIIGVTRKGFFGVEPGRSPDVWVPSMMYNQEAFANPGWSWFRILGRLAPGARRERLQAQLQPTFHRQTVEKMSNFPSIPPAIQNQFFQMTIRVKPGAVGVSDFRKTFARPLWIVLGVAAGILLIAGANVASLLLARATARAAEMAMRVSLGAGRTRLMRQLLTESLLLSLFAGALGWAIARVAAPLLVGLLSTNSNPVQFALSMNTRVLLFCVALSTLAAVLFGLFPAWQASGAQPMKALRGNRGQAGRLRMGRVFVSIQVAFAFCLVMVGAGFLFSLHNLFAVDTGFDPRGVTVLNVSSNPGKAGASQRLLMQNLQSRTAALPGIEAAAVAGWAIFARSSWTDQLVVPGKGPSEREELFYRVSPNYFAALRTPLLYGNDFQQRDSGTLAPIPTIVNLAPARRYFAGENALGKEFQRPEGKKLMQHRIVGIVANSYYGDLRNGPPPIAYVPLQGSDSFSLYIRSHLDLGSVVHMVEREAIAVGSGTRIREVTTLDTLVGNTILKEKLLAGIGGVFAALGLLLASIGLFGLLNYSVARRTKEFGIRSALGAQKYAVGLLVAKDLLAMVGGGLMIGLSGSIALMTLLGSLLFGIKAADPLVIVTATVIFLAASFVAGAIPARRAISVDPMIALRHD